MPKRAKELSAVEVRRLSRPGNHAVGGVSGLLLQIGDGRRSWILRTMVGGHRRNIGLGPFPEVSLAEAREEARRVKQQIRRGIDPIAQRRAARQALAEAQARQMNFETAARRCHAAREKEFRSAKHRRDWIASLERHAFPVIGRMQVGEIELPHILAVLEPIWETRTDTATRVRQRIESVLTWATVSGYRSGENPARWRGNLKEVLPAPTKIAKVQHHRALPWQSMPDFMARLRRQDGMGARALEFLILTAARSGEVRFATWEEIDLAECLWTVPAERMKTGREHRVPLPGDAVALLGKLPRFEESAYVFPAVRGGALSDNTLSAVCRRMEVDAVPHGFRSSFKDWARSRTRYADEVSELALAHVGSDATRAAYARDELLPQRRRLMEDWAKFLRDGSGKTAKVADFGRAVG